ncbi:hypothetical protein GCM10011414_09760 [Croceivirga lutea]|uniref:class I SAM-dependent methyltransferase n=1 Tax=Croceivirga lutea TaxID=1775167 RepID=UPI00163A08AC|nr:class I SAM-dependent methyltransferase [Croceivirga lutea]GGG42224.1 hypothetical protein GCM10011414_09760 [Croceivirga lutea]
MNFDILKPAVQDFITKNLNTDVVKLLLSKPQFKGVTQKELAEQIQCKKKSQTKLPTWFNTIGIYYPKKINIEQTSSEITAAYKANLVSGESLIDLTGGFGVDSYYFAKRIKKVTHCEVDEKLSKIVAQNYLQLNVKNIDTIAKNGLEVLKQSPYQFDYIYIDPSRRDSVKGKVFKLTDYHPNVPEHLNELFAKTNTVLIKTAPLLDISLGISELIWVAEIHIVAVKNEVKELLFLLKKHNQEKPIIKTVNIVGEHTNEFSFYLNDEKNAKVSYAMPKKYLFEPNAAILKSGGFKTISEKFKLDKLAEHSHLYTANSVQNFPGRVFEVVDTIPFQKKNLKKLGFKKANITTRNFPLSVAEIRKISKIKDGGIDYLFFTTIEDKLYCISTKKVV